MRIKVTGYMDTDKIPEEYVDTSHPMGLSEDGHLALTEGEFIGACALSEVEFEAVP